MDAAPSRGWRTESQVRPEGAALRAEGYRGGRGQGVPPPALSIPAREPVGCYSQRLGDLAGPRSTSHSADPGNTHSTVLRAGTV